MPHIHPDDDLDDDEIVLLDALCNMVMQNAGDLIVTMERNEVHETLRRGELPPERN